MSTDPIALAIPIFLGLIGLELLISIWRGKKIYRFATAIADMSCGINYLVVGVFTKAILLVPYIWLYNNLRLFTLDGWVGHLLAFLGVDLVYYCWHRWAHETNFGWGLHVVHHQSEDYNLAVALRTPSFGQFTSWAFDLPLALLGVAPEILGLHAAINLLGQFWLHTELIRSMGPLEWVLNTPSHHRVHHGTNEKYLDKNYGAILIIWDRLFGTFQEEVEQPVYGTIKSLKSYNPIWANFEYFSTLLKDSFNADNIWQAFKLWWVRPSLYFRQDKEAESPKEIEKKNAGVRIKYSPRVSLGLMVYVGLQFIPISVAIFIFLLMSESMSVLVSLAFAVTIVSATLAWGALFEKQSWSIPAEVGRLVLSGMFLIWTATLFEMAVVIFPIILWMVLSFAFLGWWAQTEVFSPQT